MRGSKDSDRLQSFVYELEKPFDILSSLCHRCFIPGLGFASGQSFWKVLDSEMTEYPTNQDVPERFKTQIHPGSAEAFLPLIQKVLKVV